MYFFMNQLGVSLTTLRVTKLQLLYKPTAVYGGDVIPTLKMGLFNYYNSFPDVIIWNGKIAEVRTDLYLLTYNFMDHLLYTRHCVRH